VPTCLNANFVKRKADVPLHLTLKELFENTNSLHILEFIKDIDIFQYTCKTVHTCVRSKMPQYNIVNYV